MKKRILLFVFSIILIASCEKDDEITVDSQPEFTMIEESISSLPGRNFSIKATINDPAGVESINLKYEPWFLDKTIIVKDSTPSTYNLDYSFQVPTAAEENSQHTIVITSTNVGGVSTSKDVSVTLDLDDEAPQIIVEKPENGSTVLIGEGDEIDFNITVSDNEQLSGFLIEGGSFSETLEISGTSYQYQNSLNIDETGSYSFNITVTDEAGNQQTESFTVNVLDELKFDKMYFTDVSTSEALSTDVFGVPALTEAIREEGEEGYVFTARYYSESSNSEIRFIPQKGSFEPYTFGASLEIEGMLTNGSSSNVNPIILPEKGYYEIKIDLRDLSYSVSSYTPSEDTFPLVQVIGTGIEINGETTCTSNVDGANLCWNFASGKQLIQDPENPYRFSATMKLYDETTNDGSNGFILNANTSGWGPFWRFDNGEDPNNAVLNGGTNFVFGPEAYGTYKFVFDTHLNRVSLTPDY
ncbi:MAG: hypothetical protein R3250_00455 [Melioribacteraceae bacterium]|nr:hypothetical protein [Melioribacteraceae bacterium]